MSLRQKHQEKFPSGNDDLEQVQMYREIGETVRHQKELVQLIMDFGHNIF